MTKFTQTDPDNLSAEQVQEILDFHVTFNPDVVLDDDGHYLLERESWIDTEILIAAIDGWYSDRDIWTLSIATTTRNQPIYGLIQIRDSWLTAAHSDREFDLDGISGIDPDDFDRPLTYMEVYSELAQSIDDLLSNLGLSVEYVESLIEQFTVHASSGNISVY